MRFVKPLDEDLVHARSRRAHRALVTHRRKRDRRRRRLARSANCWPLRHRAAHCCTLGIPDRFIEHGSREDCLAPAGLDLASLDAGRRALVGAAAQRSQARRRGA